MDKSISNVVWEEDQILKMPDEVFLNIFSFVPIARRQNAVGLVCQKFYDLLCELEQDMHPLELKCQQIFDDEIFDSIISSGRRFNDLTIELETCRVLESFERIKAITQNFGPRIVKFKLWSSFLKGSPEISESQLITILDCLPKAQEITLHNVHISQSFNIDGEDLKLHKLEKLSLNCFTTFESPAILNKIPANFLQELVFAIFPHDVTRFQRFMNQQSRIKKLEMHLFDKISFDHLQLEHLKTSPSTTFVAMINQQPKLRYIDIKITSIDDSIFSALCNLKYLEVIKTRIDGVSISGFKNLKNLTRLKELRLESYGFAFGCDHLLEFCMMKCLPIEKLTFLFINMEIPEEILVQMSLNYQRLKEFEITNRSIKIIATILEHFPSLESVRFDFSDGAPYHVLVINDDLKHENLKQLIVTNIQRKHVETSNALLMLLNACPNLERIMLSKLSDDDFKNIIKNHPHLTHLSLDFDEYDFDFYFNEEIINFLISWPHKLVYLRLIGLRSCPTYSELRTLFDELFPIITFRDESGELIMKKKNITDVLTNDF